MTETSDPFVPNSGDALRRMVNHPSVDLQFLRARTLDAATRIDALTIEVRLCRLKMGALEPAASTTERQLWPEALATTKSPLARAQAYIERGGTELEASEILWLGMP